MTRTELKERARMQLGGQIFGTSWLIALLACLACSAIPTALGSFTYGIVSIIVLGPLNFGLAYLFLKQARDGEVMQLTGILSGFQTDFSQTLLIGLMTAVYTALWSLLFVIPGIIKAYSYSMAYYLKVDHADWDWKRCIEESKNLMNGHKMELFLLDLSFLGWYIVGALCLGVGVLWVAPYSVAARTQFYDSISIGRSELV